MSRHVIVDRPDFQLVLGFDHEPRSFIGEAAYPLLRDRRGIPVAVWPPSSAPLLRRSVQSFAQATEFAGLLMEWALDRLPQAARERASLFLLGQMRPVLMREWADGIDHATPALPDFFKGSA